MLSANECADIKLNVLTVSSIDLIDAFFQSMITCDALHTIIYSPRAFATLLSPAAKLQPSTSHTSLHLYIDVTVHEQRLERCLNNNSSWYHYRHLHYYASKFR